MLGTSGSVGRACRTSCITKSPVRTPIWTGSDICTFQIPVQLLHGYGSSVGQGNYVGVTTGIPALGIPQVCLDVPIDDRTLKRTDQTDHRAGGSPSRHERCWHTQHHAAAHTSTVRQHAHPCPRPLLLVLNLQINLEDGPQGVADEVQNVTSWPSALTMAMTWDRQAAFLYGQVKYHAHC